VAFSSKLVLLDHRHYFGLLRPLVILRRLQMSHKGQCESSNGVAGPNLGTRVLNVCVEALVMSLGRGSGPFPTLESSRSLENEAPLPTRVPRPKSQLAPRGQLQPHNHRQTSGVNHKIGGRRRLSGGALSIQATAAGTKKAMAPNRPRISAMRLK